jgi:hypothetical protein
MQFDNDDPAASQLAEEARRFRSRATNERRGPLKIIVSDFEFVYDMPAFRRYQHAECDPTNGWVRWPYHHICAAAWMMLTFRPGFDQPIVGPIRVMTSNSEATIVSAYLASVTASPDCILYNWGGEQKDWPVMRRFAMEHGIVLPTQLVDLRPHSPSRIDLCNATSGQARCTHLPEYAFASGIPSKPLESKLIGDAVLQGSWEEVEEQVCADLMSTSLIAARHAITFGRCQANLFKTERAIKVAFAGARPSSLFFSTAANILSDREGHISLPQPMAHSSETGL